MAIGAASSPEWAAYAFELGQTLQRLRLTRNLSQEQVAYRARLSRFTYQKYESGLSRPDMPANPSLISILAIAQVLGVEVGDLLPPGSPDLTAH